MAHSRRSSSRGDTKKTPPSQSHPWSCRALAMKRSIFLPRSTLQHGIIRTPGFGVSYETSA